MTKKLVGLEAGRLVERVTPCLLVLERVAGTWTEVKASPYLQHIVDRDVEALVAGWYELTARDLVFLDVSDVVVLPRRSAMGVTRAWACGPLP